MRDQPAVEPPPLPARAAFERPRPAVGRLVLAGATALAVVVGVLVWQAAGPNVPRGTAATPEPLVVTAPAVATSAEQRLAELARLARTSGVPEAGETTEYIEMRAWYLNSQVSGGSTVSAVVPEIHRTWRAADGSGRAEWEWAEPEFRNDADRREWAASISGTETDEWSPGERPPTFGPARPPATADDLARYLHRPNPPDAIGPIKTFVAVHDLLRERVLTPAERAAVLELVGSLPGVTYQGTTTDRIGRAAEVFAMDSDYAGLPARYSLLVSPETNQMLGTEETLTTTPGALDVTIPAVISYETYVRADFR
ncbi:CU044_5270 family protein [Actinokineospora sp. NPDC004072]